jgi:hypothetical protein
LALQSTPRLWLIPAASLATLLILLRRRTLAGLRGVRLLLPLLATVPPAMVLWSWSGIADAIALMAERMGSPLTPHLASGAYTILAAAVGGIVFGARVGARPDRMVGRRSGAYSGRKM